jgi:hypothetical protein
MRQSAAEELPPQRMKIAVDTMTKKHNILIFFILVSFLSSYRVIDYRPEHRELRGS